MFKIGDRVLCLVDFVGYDVVIFERPIKGQHYTIREFRGKDAYLLEEVHNPRNIPVRGKLMEVAWGAYCFGPSRTDQEEKDLGFFTPLLQTKFTPRRKA